MLCMGGRSLAGGCCAGRKASSAVCCGVVLVLVSPGLAPAYSPAVVAQEALSTMCAGVGSDTSSSRIWSPLMCGAPSVLSARGAHLDAVPAVLSMAANTKRPDDRGQDSSGPRASCNLIKVLACVRASFLRDRSSSRSITTGHRPKVPIDGPRRAETISIDRCASRSHREGQGFDIPQLGYL